MPQGAHDLQNDSSIFQFRFTSSSEIDAVSSRRMSVLFGHSSHTQKWALKEFVCMGRYMFLLVHDAK